MEQNNKSMQQGKPQQKNGKKMQQQFLKMTLLTKATEQEPQMSEEDKELMKILEDDSRTIYRKKPVRTR
ncbi:hypothetical protein EVA_08351 [gut metagenome]|uniref:Uncharacterized protein n=1 Tax=gut metagenome TaxID=749906 RepID=J9CTM0_9ZZZZ